MFSSVLYMFLVFVTFVFFPSILVDTLHNKDFHNGYFDFE